MAHVQRERIAITTDASGDATSFTSNTCVGRIQDIQYVPDGSTPFDNTVDFTITGATTGKAILTKSNVAAAFTASPRQPTHDTSGTALLYAAGGTAVSDKIAVNEPIKIVTAQGGNAKTGVIYITLA